jgi:type I restriction enzyme S subunit
MRDLMLEFHDGPHATPHPAEDGPVYLGIKNITDAGSLDLTEVRHISEEDFSQWTRRVEPQAGDVVFTYEATLHRYALIPEDFRGCLGRRLALIRPDPDVVLPRFLHFLMLGPAWHATVTERIISGATVDRIPIIDFPNFPVTVPDVPTQDGVAAILGLLDDLIENNRRRIELLEEMAQAIYREWFVRFRYPGHEDATFVDSPLGPIPEGWEVRNLGDVAAIDKGISYKGAYLTEVGTPMANLKCFRPGRGFRRDGTKPYSGPCKPKHRVAPGDLIMANTDLTQSGAVIGSPAFIPRRGFESGGIISHHLFAIRCSDRDLRPFLYWLFTDDAFRSYARSVASGTTVLGFRPVDLVSFRFARPPATLLKRFAQIAVDVAELAEDLEDSIQEVAGIRDLLLPKLVTGEIDVSHLYLDAVVGSVA